MDIKLIGTLDLESVVNATQLIPRDYDEELTLDLAGVTFAKPCGIATLASLTERLTLQPGKLLIARPERDDVFRYMQNMDYFQRFKLFENENFNRHPAVGRFFRLDRVTWESDSRRLAKDILSCLQIDDDNVISDLFTCLTESIDNLHAHARHSGYAIAQSYHRDTSHPHFEIAIVDSGRGIKQSLAENSDYRISSHQEALELSCREGVSGALHRRYDPNAQNRHFGIGLSTIDKIVQSAGGRFLLCSGDSCRVRSKIGVVIKPINNWQGTIVSITLERNGIIDHARQRKASDGKLRIG